MKRVLFVDDEPRLLEGVERLMRRLRHEWQVTTATSGADALARIEQERFDFVVSDMRMPGMDGAALLAHVRERSPGTVRFVLSGQTELDVAIRSVPLAHQFLSKPCDGHSLVAALEKAATPLGMLPDGAMRERVVGLDALPSSTEAWLAVHALLADDASSIQDLAEVIAGDVAMSAKVLQLVSSSFFGSPRRGGGPAEAVALLGAGLLRELFARSVFAVPSNDTSPPPGEEGEGGSFVARVGRLARSVAAEGAGQDDAATDLVIGRVLLGLWGIGE